MLPRHADHYAQLGITRSHGEAAARDSVNIVVRVCRVPARRVLRDTDDIGRYGARKIRTRDNSCGCRAGGIAAGYGSAQDLRGGRDSVYPTRKVATIIDRVLVRGVQDGVHVCTALGIPCVPQLLPRVQSQNNDTGEDTDRGDDQENFEESESPMTAVLHNERIL